MAYCIRCKVFRNNETDGWLMLNKSSDERIILEEYRGALNSFRMHTPNLTHVPDEYSPLAGLCPRCRLSEDQIRNLEGG